MKRIATLGAALTVIGIVLAMTPAFGQKPGVRPVQPSVTQAVPSTTPQVAPAPSKAPPEVRTQWGDGQAPLPSVVDQIETKYTIFAPGVGPARASIEGASAEKNRPSPDDDEDDHEKGTP